MYILGLSCYYHDASACLVKDGKVVAAAEEERFTRKKHDTSFPSNAAAYCLEQEGITIGDIDHVGFYEKPFLKFERVLYQHLEYFPLSLRSFLSSMPSWVGEKLRIMRSVRKKLKYRGDVMFIPHHTAHAASAFYPSPFEEAAVVTVDGVGEWSTTTFGRAGPGGIMLEKEIRFPHSLGLLYSTITAYLGFSVNNSEYKVMGLAAYGTMDREKNRYYQKLKQVIDLKEDGSFRLKLDYFIFQRSTRMPSKRLCDLLGGPVSRRGASMTKRHKDIAAALQMVTEDALSRIITHAHRQTGSYNLVMAGGVALNSVYNGKILRTTPFKRVWIQPNATDGGTSLGAALFVYHSVLGRKGRHRMENAYLGPGFTSSQIKQFLDGKRIRYHELSNREELIARTAQMIWENKVVGWFQGRMEWGPRALGSRSILSNPCNPKAKEVLNEKVKHRERFRPFAPAVCEDDAPTYFDCDTPIPEPADFMLMVYPVKERWRRTLPSVTHVDGSGRLQAVRRKQNPDYYDLIKEFGKLSGVPIVINTSFNIRGEPIVCTPQDAYNCMMGTGIDCLVMDRFLIWRSENPKDLWDSESSAGD